MANENEKELAARASANYVKDGNVVGLGTGSTARFVVEALAERVKAGMKIRGIPTSVATEKLATSLGITMITLADCQDIDVCIDGADEFDPGLRLTKGGGGALLREKIVASASKQMVVIADSSKQVAVLGKFPLPVEVIKFAQPLVSKKITEMGAKVVLRKTAAGETFITDEGNYILDCNFGQIPDPPSLARKLSDTPGVVEHGLFVNLASVVLMGKGNEVVTIKRP
jgi:ribose 5-phosphate isomerase A